MQRFINDGWSFALASDKGKHGKFDLVEIPHDWLIYDVNNLYKSGVGVYKRALNVAFLCEGQTYEGQRLFINFDGVYMDSALYINGKKAGEDKNGYTAFKVDITDYINFDDENEILLEVNYKSPNSRWYSGAGIYRDVSLIVKNSCHIEPDGIYISTYKSDGNWHFTVSADIVSCGREHQVRHTLLFCKDIAVDCDKVADCGIAVDCEKAVDCDRVADRKNGCAETYRVCGEVQAWDIDDPHLYMLRTELVIGGEVQDTVYTRFGFREIEFTSDRGFFLNGRHLKLNGVCLHHDLGMFGAATHRDAIRRQFTLLREMGVNAFRTAHNPPSKTFMELADEMGFLVMSEITDMWEHHKTEYDYSRFFNDWIERDIASWVRRDRNSPSVIMWSLGNEIYDTHADAKRGAEILRRMIVYVKEHDPRENARVTFSSNYLPWENTQECADILGLVGYNYSENLYEKHHEKYPHWIIYGGETASTVQSRNIYRFPLAQTMLADDDMQCSSLGNCTTSWGAESSEVCALVDKNTPFSLGQFLWTGQDYIGEPTPYHTKNSYFGQIDTAGFFKDSFYIYKAAWVDEPVLHIFPYWDHTPGQRIDVRVVTNVYSVELFLNDKSLGVVKPGSRLIADWKIAYEKGKLRAVGYNEVGDIVVESTRSSFGDAVSLDLSTEVYGELHFVSITAQDEHGNIVENANNRIHVSVKDGELLGLDNGDSTDFEQYKTDNKRLFGGRLLAIVRAKSGGVDAPVPEVSATISDKDIPVRKIEIIRDGFSFKAKLFPENTTFSDVAWRLTNASGVDSPLGHLTAFVAAMSATVLPLGDGEVWIRCSARNGKEHDNVISQLSFEIIGKGKVFLSPYNFVAGSLCDLSNIKLTNGNERGITTSQEGVSHVGFSNLDFGDTGSDELTLPLFPLIHEDFEFEIWERMPEDGGERLITCNYDKGSVWNTYQDFNIKLPRRLKSVTTLCFVFRNKVHIKGFVFKRLTDQ